MIKHIVQAMVQNGFTYFHKETEEVLHQYSGGGTEKFIKEVTTSSGNNALSFGHEANNVVNRAGSPLIDPISKVLGFIAGLIICWLIGCNDAGDSGDSGGDGGGSGGGGSE